MLEAKMNEQLLKTIGYLKILENKYEIVYRNNLRKITNEQVREIIKRYYEDCETIESLAKSYKISKLKLGDIIHYKDKYVRFATRLQVINRKRKLSFLELRWYCLYKDYFDNSQKLNCDDYNKIFDDHFKDIDPYNAYKYSLRKAVINSYGYLNPYTGYAQNIISYMK